MDREFNQVREEVLALDRESQIRIAEEIMTHISSTPEHEAAWREEIRRRTDAYRQGGLESYPADEVMARARKKIEDAKEKIEDAKKRK